MYRHLCSATIRIQEPRSCLSRGTGKVSHEPRREIAQVPQSDGGRNHHTGFCASRDQCETADLTTDNHSNRVLVTINHIRLSLEMGVHRAQAASGDHPRRFHVNRCLDLIVKRECYTDPFLTVQPPVSRYSPDWLFMTRPGASLDRIHRSSEEPSKYRRLSQFLHRTLMPKYPNLMWYGKRWSDAPIS